MNDDDAKKAILARRARFIAAALLSAGLGARCDKQQEPAPGPCLSSPVYEDAGPPPEPCLSPPPQPCLTTTVPEPPPPDAGVRADAGPPPRICLAKPLPPQKPCLSKPRVCLDMPPE